MNSHFGTFLDDWEFSKINGCRKVAYLANFSVSIVKHFYLTENHSFDCHVKIKYVTQTKQKTFTFCASGRILNYDIDVMIFNIFLYHKLELHKLIHFT